MPKSERTKAIISELKRVKKDNELSLPRIMELIEQNGDYMSMTTLQRVFAEGSEDVGFRYEETIKPIANVLLNLEDDDKLAADPEMIFALKEIIRAKNTMIEDLRRQLKEAEEQAERAKAFLKEQIELKDSRMDEKDKIIDKLLNRVLSHDNRD